MNRATPDSIDPLTLELSENGYAVFRDALSKDTVDHLLALLNPLVARTDLDGVFYDLQGRVSRVNTLFSYAPVQVLTILAHPAVARALDVAGLKEPVPILESVYIKRSVDNNKVLPHQDFVHDRLHKAVVIGFYLGVSEGFAGALEFLPGSHQQKADMAEVRRGIDDGALTLDSPSMQPGDMLLHDPMTVHQSKELREGMADRPILYLEIHDRPLVARHPRATAEVIESRQHLFTLARRASEEGWETIPESEQDRFKAAASQSMTFTGGANYAA